MRVSTKLGAASRSTRLSIWALFGVVVIAWAAIAQACNVPVFRYALEHWRPDQYRVTLFHRGPLTDDQKAQIAPMLAEEDKLRVNLSFRAVDVSDLGDADRELFAKHEKLELPGLVVQYPDHLKIDAPVQSVALSLEAVAGLMKSPVRAELIRRLADGQTAVWLLVESGQSEADDAVAARLEGELKKLEETLKLPELTDAPEDKLSTSGPLRVAFSLLRVPRGDNAEQALVAMLLGSEPDLAERSEAMLFPVFGRGRALLPLVGPGITAENIHSSAGFLVGPCSCQVKDLNPGFDLLLAAEWETLLSIGDVPQKDSPANSAESTNEAELVAIPPGGATVARATPSPALDCIPPLVAARPSYIPQIVGGIAALAVAGVFVTARILRGTRHS